MQFALTGAGLLAADVLLPVPSSIVGTLLGARLGVAQGFLWTFFGMTVGCAIGYAVGRVSLGRLQAHLPATPTLIAVFLSRPVPIVAEAVAIAAGASGAPFWRYALAAAAGNAVYALVLAANGAALLPDRLLGPGLIVPMLAPVAAWLLWQKRERRADSDHS